MANVRITIDGNEIMNGDLGNWTTNPPDILAEQLKAGAQPTPWMRALMFTIAEAAMTDKTLSVDVQTRGAGWTMSVDG